MNDKGTCEKHGEFILSEGCLGCLAERRARGIKPENDELEDGLNAEGLTLVTEPFIVKVQYYSGTTGELSLREYTYYSADQLKVGDIVTVPVRDTTGKAKVSAVGVAESEIASFKDKVKTIPAAGAEVIVFTDEAETAGTVIVKVNPGIAPSFAKHLEVAKRLVEIASSRQIVTEADAKSVNDDLNVMAELRKAVDLERKTFTTPLNDHLTAINGAYKLITGPLTEAVQIYRRLLTAYKVEQQRKATEAEKINRDAIELARRQAEASGTGEFTVETKPVPVPFAPKLTRTDQGKSGLVDQWKYEVVDIDALPREYMIPDDAMLSSIAKQQHDKRPVKGIRFYNEPGLRVTR